VKVKKSRNNSGMNMNASGMQGGWILFVFLLIVVLAGGPDKALSDDLKPIPLMQFQLDTGRPLMHVLKERKSSRVFSSRKLPRRVLSNLLWAANGINRPAFGGRTAPSAMNQHGIDIYLATVDGLYLFDVRGHQLLPVLKLDIRALTGQQAYVAEAPVNLIFVADLTRMNQLRAEERDFYAAVDTGFISQNIYLYCASEGLATVVRGSIDRTALAAAMKLRPEQKVILAQSVGYPKK
jgi:nitroreductase